VFEKSDILDTNENRMINKTDAHLHSWDLEKIQYSWLNKEAGILYDSYTPQRVESELLSTGITSAVLVQADNSIIDSTYMFEQAALFPWIKGVVAWLPLEDPDRIERVIEEEYKSNPLFKGVRHLMHVEPDPQWILQDKVLTSLQLLAKKKIPFDAIGINLQQLDAIISMAEKIPQLNIMIDHLNQPPLNDEKKIAEWRILMTKAAMAPNMFAKISGLTTLLYQGGRNLEDELKSIIDFTVGQFGADKCCCGSDWPISLLKTTYQDSWKLYEKILVSIDSTASISQQILESTAKNFYHI